jgi:phage shock protein C
MFGLYRSFSDVVLFGVCGGIGEALGIRSSLVRLIFALLALASGVGIGLYLLCAIILPLEGRPATSFLVVLQNNFEELAATFPARRRGVGMVFIGAGLIILMMQLGLFDWLTWGKVWPLFIVAIGLGLLLKADRQG